MITKSDWDKLTSQQQWDQYCLLVSECGDSDTVDEADEDTQRLSADELLAVPPIPYDELLEHVEVNASGVTLYYPSGAPVKIDAMSPQYRQQFNQYGNTRLQE